MQDYACNEVRSQVVQLHLHVVRLITQAIPTFHLSTLKYDKDTWWLSFSEKLGICDTSALHALPGGGYHGATTGRELPGSQGVAFNSSPQGAHNQNGLLVVN